MKYLMILMLLTGCAEFQTKIDMHKDERLICKAEDMTLCKGWRTE
jgi:hypothetical protein|tara:strand:- start:36 stop:170 length:135 start_codon:yes stop_codon:yes gene_type:complete